MVNQWNMFSLGMQHSQAHPSQNNSTIKKGKHQGTQFTHTIMAYSVVHYMTKKNLKHSIEGSACNYSVLPYQHAHPPPPLCSLSGTASGIPWKYLQFKLKQCFQKSEKQLSTHNSIWKFRRMHILWCEAPQKRKNILVNTYTSCKSENSVIVNISF